MDQKPEKMVLILLLLFDHHRTLGVSYPPFSLLPVKWRW